MWISCHLASGQERRWQWMGQDAIERYRNAQEQQQLLHKRHLSPFLPLPLFHPLPFLFLFLLPLPVFFSFGRYFTIYVPNKLLILMAQREKYVEIQNKFVLKRGCRNYRERTAEMFYSLCWSSPDLKSIVNQALALCKAHCRSA